MPACFQLIDRLTGHPATLQHVDDRMRAYFGAPADSERWFDGWYDCIGYWIATGMSFQDARQHLADDNWCQLPDILNWLERNYSSNGWYQVGK